MKSYKIPITWQSVKEFDVEADSLQDAVVKALKIFFSEPDSNYIEDSFSVDEIVKDRYPNEGFDELSAYNEL